MAGKGMGCATKGGGCVMSGPKNRMVSKTSKKTGPVMMRKGGAVNAHKMMAMKGVKKCVQAGCVTNGHLWDDRLQPLDR